MLTSTRLGVVRDYAARSRRRRGALVPMLLRTRSIHGREILVERAWRGASLEEILSWCAAGGGLEPDMDVYVLGELGFVLAVQPGQHEDGRAARAILEHLVRLGKTEFLSGHALGVLLQLRVAACERESSETLLGNERIRPVIRAATTADLVNPLLFRDGDEERWLQALNVVLFGDADTGTRVGPVKLRDEDTSENLPPFDRLTAEGGVSIESATRVTVLMSCYRPTRALVTAVRSVLAQTWRNLELIVIDDASGAEYAPLLDEVARLDRRVRIVRKSVNGGTYRARNSGLRIATGEIVTTLDSDDWMHPRLVELSVRPLLEDPTLIATRSRGVRVPEDSLRLNWAGSHVIVRTATSLTFRVDPVLHRLGFFDPVRKGADTEYALRIEAAFGAPITEIPYALTVIRSGQTLSAGDFARGWRHPARRSYPQWYSEWHDRIRRGEASAYLNPRERRRFPAPRQWAKSLIPDPAPTPRLDVCFAADWRQLGSPQRSMLGEVDAALSAGLRVGLLHLESFRLMTPRSEPLCSPVMDLVSSGAVHLVHADDDLETALVMVADPSMMQYPPLVSDPLRVERVVVVAHEPPCEGDGSDQRYVVADVTERSQETFHARLEWLPRNDEIRQSLLENDPQVPLASSDPLEMLKDESPCDRTVSRDAGSLTAAPSGPAVTRLRVERASGRSLRVQVAEPFATIAIQVSDMDDDQRPVQIVVAYREGHREEVAEWITGHIDDFEQLDPGALDLNGAPPAASALLITLGGTATLVSRA